MSVVAKMFCHYTGKAYDAQPESDTRVLIRLGAVYEPDDEKRAKSENAIFGEATPYAELSMSITNPEASSFFKNGKQYYVTFTEAPD